MKPQNAGWLVKITDPSGETRILSLGASARLGRSESVELPLRDLTLPEKAGQIWLRTTDGEPTFWLKGGEGVAARIGDLEVREAELPARTKLTLGDTELTIEPLLDEKSALPPFPQGARPWLTKSPKGRETLWNTRRAATTSLSVYLAGETGIGKEVLAQLTHSWSDRASGPFIPLHCGALAPSLAESELFGHTKGAFTCASHPRTGALMQAHNVTLYLLEVGDRTAYMQVKPLRFLENGEIRPVGSDRVSHADVRIVCATHLPLEKLVEEGRFRRDLYYRIASITIGIPPLRDRPEDVGHLLESFASEYQKAISRSALRRLKAYPWPGNVRELKHAVDRASGLSGPYVSLLGESEFEFILSKPQSRDLPETEPNPTILTFREMERLLLHRTLKACNGNRAETAKILGVARSTLFEMLKRQGIVGPRQALRAAAFA